MTQDRKTRVRALLKSIETGDPAPIAVVNQAKYIQHNPQTHEGSEGLEARNGGGFATEYNRLHRVLAEGNFVLAVSQGSLNGDPTSFYDLYRLNGGKLVEHWDTIEKIPPRSARKNDNGKF